MPTSSGLERVLVDADVRELIRAGVRADVCGHLFVTEGAAVAPERSARVLAVRLSDLRAVSVRIGVVVDAVRAAGARAVIAAGVVNALVADAATARAMLD